MRNKNRESIEEMKMMLDENRSLKLENFVMPHMENEEDSFDEEEENYIPKKPQMDMADTEEQSKDDITGIEKELIQIRKIALSAINRLADKPNCPQYDTMKKVWNMVDKAIEQPQSANKSIE